MMDNKAQVSLEYLTMVAIALMLAAIATLLAARLFSIKDDVKSTIELYRNKTIQIE